MDRVARRYADPFAFLGAYLRVGRLHECVTSIIEAINKDLKDRAEEKLNDQLWDLWLHKYHGNQSFGDWKKAFVDPPEHEAPNVVDPEAMQKNLDVATQTLKKLAASQKGGGVNDRN